MLILPPVPFRARRGRVKSVPVVPVGAELTLVFSSYDDGNGVITLRFDRAINSAALIGAAITVKDGAFDGAVFNGVSAVTVIDPETIRLTLVPMGPYTGDDVTLTVTSLSGIVAVNDGGTWPGVMNLVLPFP